MCCVEGEQPFNEATACTPRPTAHWNLAELTLLIAGRRNTVQCPRSWHCALLPPGLAESCLFGATRQAAAAHHAVLSARQQNGRAVLYEPVENTSQNQRAVCKSSSKVRTESTVRGCQPAPPLYTPKKTSGGVHVLVINNNILGRQVAPARRPLPASLTRQLQGRTSARGNSSSPATPQN
jgi:hypothetical protein